MGIANHCYVGPYVVVRGTAANNIDVRECSEGHRLGYDEKFCSECGGRGIDKVIPRERSISPYDIEGIPEDTFYESNCECEEGTSVWIPNVGNFALIDEDETEATEIGIDAIHDGLKRFDERFGQLLRDNLESFEIKWGVVIHWM